MPYKNKHKNFSSETYYHVYARGVNKRKIFKDNQDYNLFVHQFNRYLTKGFKIKKYTNTGKEYYELANSSYGQVKIFAFCLISNHFHLLLENVTENGVPLFMRKVLSNYANYFNNKYKRQGPVIQGGYRAVKINTDLKVLIASEYIHNNPIKHRIVKNLDNYSFSSYNYYKNEINVTWLTKIPIIKEYFNTIKNYKAISKTEVDNYSRNIPL